MDSIVPQDDTPRKQCYRCKAWKPATFEYFYHNKKTDDGFCVSCKDCYSESTQQRRENPKEVLPEGYKRCPSCEQILPATPEFFVRNKREFSGLNTYCRKCWSTRYRKNPLVIDDLPEGHKRCTQCKDIFPASPEYFPRQTANKRWGLGPACKPCQNAMGRDHYQRNKEKRRAKSKEWEEANQEYFTEIKRQYRQTHKEELAAWQKQYNKEHPEIGRIANRNRRSRKKAVPGEHTPEQILAQLESQNFRCYYARCGFSKFPRVKENGKWKYVYTVDHTYPLVRIEGTDIPGNDMGYLVLCCKSCNDSKGTKFPWEWIEGGRLL